MDKFTTEKRVKIIEFYFENRRSIVATQRSYMRHFNVRHPPSRPAIMNLVTRFQEHGSVNDRSRSGRGRSVRTRENTEAASRSIEENPNTSTRRRSQELGISRSSLQRIQRDLHMYPYKVEREVNMKTVDFVMKGTPLQYLEVLKFYDEAIKIKSSQKKKKEGESLAQLDKWYQGELGKLAMSRSPQHITKEELVRLMKWKLSRGKFRPRLVELAGSNSEEIVKTASQKGIKLALKDKVKEAVNELVVLKGIGPATASGILAACVPEKCCFFADEVAHAIPCLASLKYNLEEYKFLNHSMVECAQRLNKELLKGEENENAEADWTPHKVELALWTHSIIEQNKPELLADMKLAPEEDNTTRKKRKLV